MDRTFRRAHLSSLILAVVGVLGSSMTALAQTDEGSRPVIVLINSNSNVEATRSMADLARSEAEDAAAIEERSIETAPPHLTTPADMRAAASGVVEIGIEAARTNQVNAIIVSAFSDPGLDELRGQVSVSAKRSFTKPQEAGTLSGSSP